MIKVFYADWCRVDLPKGHRFPMEKYELLRHQLILEGVFEEKQLHKPEFIDESIILSAHDAEYWDAIKRRQLDEKAIRKLGFPLTEQLIKRSYAAVSGTFWAMLECLKTNVAINLAGGTHHAFKGHGEGYCLLNDVAIAVSYGLTQKLFKKVLILDLDVHQGNGNAAFFLNQPNVFTYSIHCQDNYPLEKIQSSLDIGLPATTDDQTYFYHLSKTLPEVMQDFRPDIVFYIAGMDVLEGDILGKFALTIQGCFNRDKFVVDTLLKFGTPFVVVMGGGYPKKFQPLLSSYTQLYRYIVDVYS